MTLEESLFALISKKCVVIDMKCWHFYCQDYVFLEHDTKNLYFGSECRLFGEKDCLSFQGACTYLSVYEAKHCVQKDTDL
jgi:hypothetical protein